jgi:hypothetical protein
VLNQGVQMNMRKTLSLLLLAVLLVSVAAYATATSYSSAGDKRRDEARIRAILDSTSAGWNEGNLQQYLAAPTRTKLQKWGRTAPFLVEAS